MSGNPFILVPWQNDFIAAVLETTLADSEKLENSIFVFPHTRPARYLERAIREDRRIKKPCLTPKCLTSSQLFQAIWNKKRSPALSIGNLDRVGLLLDCLRAEQKAHPGRLGAIPTGDAKAFFPWGMRLADLFEECFNHGCAPSNFLHLEGELMPFASAILSRLGNLYRRYVSALQDENLTTPGFTASYAASMPYANDDLLHFAGGKNIYICGFHSLSGAEDKLFRHLWLDYKARVLIHADPALAENSGHWSCAAIGEWRRAWRASFKIMPAAADKVPRLRFYAGYDLHSQLAFLRRSIHKRGEELGRELEDSAIILPDTSLLMPVLHHIQADDVNISMGYPLSNTSLQRFIDAILALHENCRAGGYYWKDCIRLLRQPYLKMFCESPAENGSNPWRGLLLAVERKLRDGRRYVDFAALVQECLSVSDEEADFEKQQETLRRIWKNIESVCLDSWQDLRSLGKLGEALEKLVDLLLEHGKNIWPRFPIDAECLSRFTSSLIPELKNSVISGESLPQATIFSIFRELVLAARVPFDAYPLTALQIMGLLESRLLSFKSLFILDAGDDLLPGGSQHDPLLPDSLRTELGLPDAARRQRLTAYYFFRLLQSADEAHIFWQEGVESQGLMDEKKLRSRFVEELIWREEQRIGRRLEPDRPVQGEAPELPPLVSDGPFLRIGSRLSPFRSEHRSIAATAVSRGRLKRLLSSSISATSLNRYLRCPAEFYYRELAGIRPAREVLEEEDTASVGTLFHTVLKDFYSGQLGRKLTNESLSRSNLLRLYKNAMAQSLPISDMPADAGTYLKLAGERRLRDYLERQPNETVVRALEMPVSAQLRSGFGGKTFQLFGCLDRIDERLQPDGKTGLVILDYKTGRFDKISPEIWNMQEIWRDLENGPDLSDREFFCNLADFLPDVQLPFYLYLAYAGKAELSAGLDDLGSVSNAGWVDLREKGGEYFIFSDELSRERRAEIIENKIGPLLDYLLCHLAGAENFCPRSGRHCAHCEYTDICIVLSTK